ncbi:MAG: vitamin B12 dependent-methionine synthase activation domain-containing protein, partial [Flavitalea sp.]
ARVMKKSVAVLTPYIEAEKELRRQAGGTEAAGAAKILLATVKGDVHDIGKNIVGVVLGCNGYDIIDLGVMVSADRILDAAKKEKVDMIGLSGLITPSLDEMVHVAREMKRQGFEIPLMIGGATTSRMHTAVRIEPEYEKGVVHILDASRSVTAAGSLLSKEQKPEFLEAVKNEYTKLREDFASKRTVKQYLPFEEAQKNRNKIDWENYNPVTPQFTGSRVFKKVPIADLVEFIDWQPFFIAWEMHGKFPGILEDNIIGAEATKLYNDANALLKKIVEEEWLEPRAVIGFWPAQSNGKDTIALYDGGKELKLEFLRQQIKKAPGQPNLSLADFIAPASSEKQDHIGAFAVTIHGIEKHIERFVRDHDDYNKIMLQALADRLAEALAEYMHVSVRKEFWGYATEEHLSKEDLIREKYQGIRPAPGYPACPDHTEKTKLFGLLNATEAIDIQLTESLAMYPASSVCGWYFANPESKYFGVGKINEDQFRDYANRKGMNTEEAERWLRPVMAD